MSIWIIEQISEIPSNIRLIYIWDLVVLLLMEDSSALFVPFQTIFWSVNCKNLVYKLCMTFWKCQDTQTLFNCLYRSVFSTNINRKIIFNCLLLFNFFCLISKWYESVNSTIFFWHAQKLRQGVYFRAFEFVIYGKSLVPTF